MTLQELLQTLVNKHGSDLHLRSGGPPYIRVDGDLSAVTTTPLAQAEVEQMLMQVAPARAKRIYDEKGECDFSFQAGDVARFLAERWQPQQPTTM